ncbi:hypothetical protein IWZ03DRAFT_144636 [Phyllosticta citriasiana]|uniref:Uncharacterized protein n=1 Tax=Phyllosticta citriasiana TaxID=595635 RepID=A0ABR1KT56_9PEZI
MASYLLILLRVEERRLCRPLWRRLRSCLEKYSIKTELSGRQWLVVGGWLVRIFCPVSCLVHKSSRSGSPGQSTFCFTPNINLGLLVTPGALLLFVLSYRNEKKTCRALGLACPDSTSPLSAPRFPYWFRARTPPVGSVCCGAGLTVVQAPPSPTTRSVQKLEPKTLGCSVSASRQPRQRSTTPSAVQLD